MTSARVDRLFRQRLGDGPPVVILPLCRPDLRFAERHAEFQICVLGLAQTSAGEIGRPEEALVIDEIQLGVQSIGVPDCDPGLE